MKKIHLQVVADSEVPYHLIQKAMQNQDDIALQEGILDIRKVGAIDEETLPDVFLVSMKYEKLELASVVKITKQLARPVLVYTSFAEQPGYMAYLKKAGAFEVVAKMPPNKAKQTGYFRHLGIKLASLTRSADTFRKNQEKQQRNKIVSIKSNKRKLPITGSAAKVVLAVGLEGQDPRPLLKLLAGLKRLQGVAFLVAHRFPDDVTRGLVEKMNEMVDYHLTLVNDGQSINEHTALIAPYGKNLVVADKRKVEIEEQFENESVPNFDMLFKSVANEYGRNSVGVLLGTPNSDGMEGVQALNDTEAVTFIQADDDKPNKPTPGLRRELPFSLLTVAVHRQLSRLVAKLSA